MDSRRWLERDDKPRLAYALAIPEQPAIGAILITHGFTEHASCYGHIVERWLARGFVVASYDCRGHGESGGVRAYIDDYRDYVGDLADMLVALQDEPAWAAFERPILFGHSTGCLATILVAAERPRAFAGIGLSSPYLELAVRVSRLKKCFARGMAKIYPQYWEANRLDPSKLTRDPAFRQRIAADALRLRRVTAGWFAQTLAAQVKAFDVAPSMTLPVFCMVGSADRIATPAASRRWFDRLSSDDKVFRVVTEGRHEILNDLGYEEHIDAFADHFSRWVGSR